jgi:transketolase
LELLKLKINNDNHLVYTLHGGELQEGQNWEAIMYASAKKVDNLIATIDLNGKQIDGATDEVLPMGSIRAKFEAFDWDVLDIKGKQHRSYYSGNDRCKIKNRKGKTSLCVLHTEMGNG